MLPRFQRRGNTMRTLVILLALLAVRAEGAERTWTIARDVYTAEAELIAVRGDLAYLKIDGKVEEIPIERLSARGSTVHCDRCRSRRFRRGRGGPAGTGAGNGQLAKKRCRCRASPMRRRNELELNAPDLAPAYGGAPIRQQLGAARQLSRRSIWPRDPTATGRGGQLSVARKATGAKTRIPTTAVTAVRRSRVRTIRRPGRSATTMDDRPDCSAPALDAPNVSGRPRPRSRNVSLPFGRFA